MLRYGPFPLKWERFGICLAALVIALGLAFAGTLHTSLHCANQTCRLDQHGPFGTRTTTFPRSAIHDVRVVKNGGKSVSYSLALVDGRGAETRLSPGSKSAIDAAAVRARTFFVDQACTTLDVIEPQKLELLGIGVILACVAIAIARSGARGRFSRKLRIDGRHLVMRSGFFGGRTESIDLPDVAAVEVETGTLHNPWKSRGQLDESAGRIVFVGSDRQRVALTEQLLPGVEVHERTAGALREIFGLAPKSLPTAAAPTPTSFAAYKPILAMFAFTTVASIVGNLVLRSRANESEGTLEVSCTNRCKFQGMECMPGGSWGSTLKPGDYAFEVFDASSPTQWTTRTVKIEVGKTTRFACTPR